MELGLSTDLTQPFLLPACEFLSRCHFLCEFLPDFPRCNFSTVDLLSTPCRLELPQDWYTKQGLLHRWDLGAGTQVTARHINLVSHAVS